MQQYLQNKKGLVQNVFDQVYDRYDLMNDFMSLGVHRLWKKNLINMMNPSSNQNLIDVACGTGGMATNLDQFGPALKLPWTRLEAPELTKELRNRMVDGCNAVAKDQSFEEMVAQRDREIVGVLNALRQARLK